MFSHFQLMLNAVQSAQGRQPLSRAQLMTGPKQRGEPPPLKQQHLARPLEHSWENAKAAARGD